MSHKKQIGTISNLWINITTRKSTTQFNIKLHWLHNSTGVVFMIIYIFRSFTYEKNSISRIFLNIWGMIVSLSIFLFNPMSMYYLVLFLFNYSVFILFNCYVIYFNLFRFLSCVICLMPSHYMLLLPSSPIAWIYLFSDRLNNSYSLLLFHAPLW